MQQRTLLTPKQFEQHVPWSIATIRRRLKAGALPSTQPGGPGTGWLIDLDAFRASLVQRDSETNNASKSDVNGANPDHAKKLSGPDPQWLKNLRTNMNNSNGEQR